MDLRRQRVLCFSDRHQIVGSIALPREGHRSRLSDYFNQRDWEFVPIEEAEVRSHEDPDVVEHHPFLLVSRRHLTMVTPIEEP